MDRAHRQEPRVGGVKKAFETMQQYEERMKGLRRTSGTGTILDYLVHGERDDYAERRAKLSTLTVAELSLRLVALGVGRDRIEALGAEPDILAGWILHVEDMRQPVAKEGRPADVPMGVGYIAPWELPADGFSEHCRRAAEALASAGCPVHLRSPRPSAAGLDPDIEARCAALARASIGRYSVTIHQVVPHEGLLDRLTRPTPSGARVLTEREVELLNLCRVLYTVWERGPVPEGDARALDRVGQAWVACRQDAERLCDAGVREDKVRVVPVPFAPNDPHLVYRGRARAAGVPRFVHIGKWEPRKAQDQILGAFLCAFRPGEAELYLKTSRFAPKIAGYPAGPTECVRDWMQTPRVAELGWRWPSTSNAADLGRRLADQGIKIYQAILPEPTLVAMQGYADVYVTLSRGEGFDMPAFHAKLAGKRLVYTPSGGPQDFAHPSDLRVEPSGLVPTHPLYRWPAGSRYLDYRFEDAVVALQRAAALVGMGPAPIADSSAFSSARVGAAMLGHLQEMLDTVGGKIF